MRFMVGCAGQFALHQDGSGSLHLVTDDQDEAIASCATGPVGCEVYDTVTRRWIGPMCQEEIDEAKARIEARAA